MNKLKLYIPEKVFRNLIICTGIIVFFILVVILPLSRYNAAVTSDISKIHNQIEEQKNIDAAYAILIKNNDKKDLRILPDPPRTILPRQEAGNFQEVFRRITEKAGLKMVSVSPELSAQTVAPNYFLYTGIVKGEFSNFRKMLIGLGYVPYLDKIEEISIQQYPDALEFKMKISIAAGS